MRFINYKWRTKGCFASKYFGIYELHCFGAGFVKRTLFFRSKMVGISHFSELGIFLNFLFSTDISCRREGGRMKISKDKF